MAVAPTCPYNASELIEWLARRLYDDAVQNSIRAPEGTARPAWDTLPAHWQKDWRRRAARLVAAMYRAGLAIVPRYPDDGQIEVAGEAAQDRYRLGLQPDVCETYRLMLEQSPYRRE